MDAQFIADKYIARDGSAPVAGVTYVKTIIKELADQDKISLLATVCSFIVFHKPNDMYGGRKASEAWQAMCAILDIEDDDTFYRLFRDDNPKPQKETT
jgi:hypothetical protein